MGDVGNAGNRNTVSPFFVAVVFDDVRTFLKSDLIFKKEIFLKFYFSKDVTLIFFNPFSLLSVSASIPYHTRSDKCSSTYNVLVGVGLNTLCKGN